MDQSLGFAHFLSQTDTIGRIVLAMLFAMSVASWYLIVTKTLGNYLAGKRADAFLKTFWAADSVEDVRHKLHSQPIDNAFAALARDALDSASDADKHGMQKLAAAGGLSEF